MALVSYKIPLNLSMATLNWIQSQPGFQEITYINNMGTATLNHPTAQDDTNFKASFAQKIDDDTNGILKYHPLFTSLQTNVTSTMNSVYTYAVKTSDQTLIGTTYTDVSGTGLAVAANTNYEFEFQIIADADAVTTGIDLAVNGPAIGTGTIQYTQTLWTSATTQIVRPVVAYDSNSANPGSAGLTKAIYTVQGILRNGATLGTLIARIKREAVGTGPNVRAGSFGRLRSI